MTTQLLPLNTSFSHHHYRPQSKPIMLCNNHSIKTKMTHSSSMSLPILYFDSVERFPLKTTGSLPDIFSATTEIRQRTTSLNESLSTNSLTTNKSTKETSPEDCTKSQFSLVHESLSNSNNSDSCQNENVINDSPLPKENTPSVSEPVPGSAPVRRRKNSSMTPVVPDLELMAKLRIEDEKTESKKETFSSVPQQNGGYDCKSIDSPDSGIKTPSLSQCGESFYSETKFAEEWLCLKMDKIPNPQQEISMALLSTISMTFDLSNKNQITIPNKGNKPCDLSKQAFPNKQQLKAAKTLQPFGQDDRVRRTSILRTPKPLVANLCDVSYQKKNVRFADTVGHQLENVRYYVISPQVNRRYSSYNAPTYLSNGDYNSPFNLGLTVNNKDPKLQHKPLGTNTTLVNSLNIPNSPRISVEDFDENINKKDTCLHNARYKLSPRYALEADFFASPSLQPNFLTLLEQNGVRLYSLTTAETTIYGTVSVMNFHFTKRVIVRYTFNDWKTYIEREAVYMLGSCDGQTDKFSFVIYARPEDFAHNMADAYLGNQAIKFVNPRLHFAIRFITGDGREFWDNNGGNNYCLNLRIN